MCWVFRACRLFVVGGCCGVVGVVLLVVVWFSTRRWLRVFSMVLGVFVVGGVALLVGFV